MSTALRSVGLLDVLSSTPAEPSGRAPCIHTRLRRLATKSGEKSGLGLRVPHILMHNNKIDWSITKQYSSQCNILEAPEPA